MQFSVAGSLQTWEVDLKGMRLEYSLEGDSNFIAWKHHKDAMLNNNGLLEYVKRDIPKPRSVVAQNLSQWKKDVAKARRIIPKGVRDHIVSNIHGK